MNGLLGLIKDDDNVVHFIAVSALVQLGNSSLEVVNQLLSLLKYDIAWVRSSAAESLGELGKKSDIVLPALVKWIDRQPDDVPIGAAIDALRSILE